MTAKALSSRGWSSRGEHGILSHNGLLGGGDVDLEDLNESDYDHQYDVFLSGASFGTYSLYKSASGAQALALQLSAPDQPVCAGDRPAQLPRPGCAAACLSSRRCSSPGFFAEFGWLDRRLPVVTTRPFAVDHVVWAQPFLLHLGFVPAPRPDSRLPGNALPPGRPIVAPGPGCRGLLGGVLFKCLTNGYDFIIPALSMPVIPVRLLCGAGPLAIANGSSVERTHLAREQSRPPCSSRWSFLRLQLQASRRRLSSAGCASILSTLSRRTYADPKLFPAYAESLRANPWSVLWTYIAEDNAMGYWGCDSWI